MSAATVHAVNQGVRIAYDVVGTGDAVVLVHGLGYARWGWEPVADQLAEEFRVILLDNRGIGESDAPPGPYTARRMAEDVVAVLDAVGVERAHVVGTSLGGMVAQEVALGWPQRVDRLVLVCTTPGGPKAFPLPRRTLELMASAPTLPQEAALRRFVENALGADTVARRPELADLIYERRLQHPPDPAGWQAQAAAGVTFDAFDRLGSITAPTLVVHGTDDGVVDSRNARLLAEAIPRARLELFAGGGHLFFWEQPERFVEVVRDFLTPDGL
jgi:pimeloyl-ACP methyl ester carboxylesterase